jgi:hypothetical protein
MFGKGQRPCSYLSLDKKIVFARPKLHSSRSGFSRPQSRYTRFNHCSDGANSDVSSKEGAVIDARETLKLVSSLTSRTGMNDISIKLKSIGIQT